MPEASKEDDTAMVCKTILYFFFNLKTVLASSSHFDLAEQALIVRELKVRIQFKDLNS